MVACSRDWRELEQIFNRKLCVHHKNTRQELISEFRIKQKRPACR